MAFVTYKDAALAFRKWINDSPQLNTLDRDFESTEDELEDFIKDALNDINLKYEPKTRYQLKDVIVEPGLDEGRVAWSMLKTGALLQLLTVKGIISARNTITYNDQGGVSVTEMDKYGRYLAYFNVLTNKYERDLMQLKVRANLEQGWGSSMSPMGWDYFYS